VIVNGDYLINSKQTLATRYFYSREPQIQSLGGLLPGSPSILYYSNTNAVAKLTSLVNSSFINEVHGSFQRNLSVQNASNAAAHLDGDLEAEEHTQAHA
jgi:hypothetical protein